MGEVKNFPGSNNPEHDYEPLNPNDPQDGMVIIQDGKVTRRELQTDGSYEDVLIRNLHETTEPTPKRIDIWDLGT